MSCRILHLIPTLDWGSAELQLSRLLPRMAAAGLQQHVITLRRSECSVMGNSSVAVETLAAPHRFDLSTCRRLRQKIRSIQPDIIHTWRPESWWYAKLAAPSIHKISSHWDRSITPGWMRWAQAQDRLTRLAAPWLDESLPARAVDYALLDYDESWLEMQKKASREWLADRLAIPKGHHWISCIAPLRRGSRLKDAIWVADLLKVVRDDVHLIIGGRGPLLGRLHRFREQVRIEDRVHFVRRSDQIEHALQASDCFWATGHGEEGAGAVLEAIARRVPVMAADVPLYRRYVEADSTGWLVALGNRADWAKQSKRMLDHPEVRQRMASAAHRACPKGAVANIADFYASIYYEQLDARRAA